MDGIALAPAAPAPAHGLRLSYTTASFLTAASVVLLLLYLTGRFIWLYNKEATTPAAASSSSSPLATPPCIVRAVSMSVLPVFVHMAAPGASAAERSPECAVCLSEFRERETGRLLPVCGHGFHEGCIVTWLRVNTTCPVCRAAVATK
ncbi:hypothetical protein E2562_020418 [Oryza meyeriana var. granulata]|uniref:RING-type domain-containing protein n=1 Tax=Oryza meyeriana var. granulata TaxID=110450 RepID=A0A6G1D5F4_9ORYZ|nr:hypothetical protein E2562_020418 [Oryza meyeriana var. granulata]